MEITPDTIIAAISLFVGGGGGAFFTWRYQRKKARAEAKEAEAAAEKAKYEAMQANAQLIKDIQTSYQQLTADLKTNLDTQQEYNEEQKQYIAELKEDRAHLRKERDDQRLQIERLTRTMNEWKTDSDEKIRELQAQVARNGRQIECMRPLLCGRENCAIRVPVVVSDRGVTIPPQQPAKDIEPIAMNDL